MCILNTWVTTIPTLNENAQSCPFQFKLSGDKKFSTWCKMTKHYNPTFRTCRQNWMWNFPPFILWLVFNNNQFRHPISGGLGVEIKLDLWKVAGFSLMLTYFCPFHSFILFLHTYFIILTSHFTFSYLNANLL